MIAHVVLSVLAVTAGAPAAADPGYHVAVDATPWKQLVQDAKPQRWVVVALPSGDPALDAVADKLQRRLVEALATHRRVRSASGATAEPGYATQPDDRIAVSLAEAHDATRVLVVRMYPAGAEGGAPKVLFTVLDAEGESLASATSLSVVVRKQGKVSKGVERIFRESDRERRAESDDNEEDADESEAAEKDDPARAEFRKRALLARVVEDEETGEATWVIQRDGHELNEEELSQVGAPALEIAEPGWLARRWPLVAFGPLEPLAAAIPLGGCVAGCCAAPAGLAAMVFVDGLMLGAGPAEAARQAQDGAVLGSCCAPLTGLGGLVVALIPAALVAAGGVVGMLFAPRAGRNDNAVPAFVTRHNKDLADELGLRTRKLPRRYFPAK
ncbi:MAG: hypothetical protein HY904_20340 [Deltaproteobacteria bacterium]|nr:hypothetical protein [Deltaproteobacteria bacterium]